MLSRTVFRVFVGGVVLSSFGLMTACGSPAPTTKADVCTNYNALGTQLLQGNGIFGNPLFKQTGKLGDVAGRYNGSTDLSSDANQLKKISKQDSLTGAQLQSATTNIADLCGHPLGLNFGE